MRVLVTGAAGFVASNLVDRLLERGFEVIGFDNFSTGQIEFLEQALRSPRFSLVRGDLLQFELAGVMKGTEIVFHLGANADVRFGLAHPDKDLRQNTVATLRVLEAMRINGVRRIVFSSTGSVYGEPKVFPTPEDAAFPVQTSLYAASKLAAEALISAYCETFDMQAHIFRFVSILGERYTHGHVLDFYKQLIEHPDSLHVLGNGKQRKSYLYVQDCIDAIMLALEKAHEKVNVLNLGHESYCEVNASIGWICAHLGLNPALTYAGGDRGWIGDSPFIFLDCLRMKALGWKPRVSIQDSVIRTLEYLKRNSWVLNRR